MLVTLHVLFKPLRKKSAEWLLVLSSVFILARFVNQNCEVTDFLMEQELQ